METPERYYVVEVEGWPIDPRNPMATCGRDGGLSCSVLDRVYAHREVARFESSPRPRALTRRNAAECAARLNEAARAS